MTKVHGFVLSQGVCPKSDRVVVAGRRPAPMEAKAPGTLPFQTAIDVEVGADVVDKLLNDGCKWLVGKPYKAKGGVKRLLEGHDGKVVCQVGRYQAARQHGDTHVVLHGLDEHAVA